MIFGQLLHVSVPLFTCGLNGENKILLVEGVLLGGLKERGTWKPFKNQAVCGTQAGNSEYVLGSLRLGRASLGYCGGHLKVSFLPSPMFLNHK